MPDFYRRANSKMLLWNIYQLPKVISIILPSPLEAKPYPQVGKVAKQELRNESEVPKQELGNQVIQLVPKLLLGNVKVLRSSASLPCR
jgi:hypothetical protein